MEPGEYSTNVLSIVRSKPSKNKSAKLTRCLQNNLTVIHYDYFFFPTPLSASAKIKILEFESKWRQDGKLVFCDLIRERIWVFRDGRNLQHSESTALPDYFDSSEIRDLGSFKRESGKFEPASLIMNKNSSNFSNMSNSSSMSSTLENMAKISAAAQDKILRSRNSANEYKDSKKHNTGLQNSGDKDINTSPNEIHENFLSAVLGSVMYQLCRNNRYIQFNSRTLIYVKPQSLYFVSPDAVEFATLDIGLTSMGTLVVKAYFDTAYGFRNLTSQLKTSFNSENLEPGASLWLAPSGIPANFYCTHEDLGLEILESPKNQRLKNFNESFHATIKSQKKQILDLLSFRGLDPVELDKNGWLLVQTLNDSTLKPSPEILDSPTLDESGIVPWPALLCFQNFVRYTLRSKKVCKYSKFLRDPLTFAQEWFTSQEHRAKILSKRQIEREKAEASKKERAETEARASNPHLDSPLRLRRESVFGNIYPTPPGALHHFTGAQSSLDSNVTTPIISSNSAHSENVSNKSGNNDSNKSIHEGSAHSENKENSTSSHLTVSGSENDNIMSDLDEVLFNNDVTDADFNFFDEPDEVTIETEARPLIARYNSTIQELGHIDKVTFSENSSVRQEEENSGMMLLNRNDIDENVTQKEALFKLSNFPTQLASFSKETVFEKLHFQEPHPPNEKRAHRLSRYDRIDFSQSLIIVDEKYGASGQFKFSIEKSGSKISGIPSLLQKTHIDNELILYSKKKDLKRKRSTVLPKRRRPTTKNNTMDSSVNSDISGLNSSQNSEEDETDLDNLGSCDSSRSGINGVLESDEIDELRQIHSSPIKKCETPASFLLNLNNFHLSLLNIDSADWPLEFYISPLESDIYSNILTDQEFIATTQILADQAISSTFKLPAFSGCKSQGESQHIFSTRRMMRSLGNATKHYFQDVNACNFRNFLDIQSIHISNQVLRLPPRPNANLRVPTGPNDRSSNPFNIPPPQVEVRRSDSGLSVLPTAVTYWENLGLSPSAGVKNIESVCVHPDLEGIAANTSVFLDRMKNVYESSRFGSHQRIPSEDVTDGLIPFTIDDSSNNSNLATLKEITGKLSRVFSSLSSQDKNLVVYFAYPVNNTTLVVHICSAFQHLFNVYRKLLLEKRVNPTNEIVLQLVPLDLIASPSSVAVLKPSEYFRLALELYDRCINFMSSSSTPAIILESPIPKSIDFKLNSNPSASLLNENTCLHLAYAESNDGRWITVAWTDNRGAQQMTASYCLGRKNEALTTPFARVACEVWETTLNFTSNIKIHRRIIIAKAGVMEPSEIETWTGLASKETNPHLNLILVTTKSNPSLRLLPSPVSLYLNEATNQSPTTPLSAGAQSSQFYPLLSPDQVSQTIDIQNDVDTNARIIDSTDQTWGAILSHRLNNSNSLVEINLALISGYLIKRGGLNSDDPPAILEVNIVYGEIFGNPRTFHETLLKEILGYFRCLATLARVRGIIDPIREICPWHIAAVEKAVKALYTLM
ncbi:Mediator of RNA polymerase II transcription subunit 13 [Golovinomyces cichoracearum]|uniref:Mediator of RNA polymerase II transcription subunit 13 n=1 Tax=Golovinomyces cichoracearum TaxID=62708 RepID=A0A420J9F8_9PEZI|nr:Mediator of RNA polymerase II transcription subunit 13 [Golovinomyces cichoracearum]